MTHPIHRVTGFTPAGRHTLRVRFDDGTEQTIDFSPVLSGELFGPLKDSAAFDQVQLDPEVRTLVWATGAAFDPATLHDWPEHVGALTEMARRWERGVA